MALTNGFFVIGQTLVEDCEMTRISEVSKPSPRATGVRFLTRFESLASSSGSTITTESSRSGDEGGEGKTHRGSGEPLVVDSNTKARVCLVASRADKTLQSTQITFQRLRITFN